MSRTARRAEASPAPSPQDRVPSRVLLLALAAIVCSGCATPTPFDPFQIPREQLRDRVRTIAVVPLHAAFGLIDEGRAQQEVLSPLVERLREAGYGIVAPEVWTALWTSYARDLGEVYDPSTARADSERWEIVESAVYSALASGHGADAVLYTSLELVDLLDTGSEVVLCGAIEPVYWPGPRPPRHTVLARGLCLQVALFDMEESFLYGIRSGVEVIETYAEQTRARRSIEDRVRDEKKLHETIDRLVGPLVELRAGSVSGAAGVD